MRERDLEPRKFVEHPIIDQRGLGIGFLERLAERDEQAVARKPRIGIAGRMHEDRDLQRLGALPERAQGGIAKLHLVDARGDDDALELELGDRAFQLADRKARVLQRHRADADEPIRVLRHQLGGVLVVEPLEPQTLLRVERVAALVQDIGADDLDVDAHLVHGGKAQVGLGHAAHLRLRERPHRLAVLLGAQPTDHRQRVGRLEHFRRHEMRVEVDHHRLPARGSAVARTKLLRHPASLARRATLHQGLGASVGGAN
jgi:hypothetical protein